MNIIIALCLVCMLAILISTIVKLCVNSRSKRLEYLNQFRKGKFTLIYIVAIPLYLIGFLYGGAQFGQAILESIKAAIDLVVLNFDYNSISALMQASLPFRIAIDLCFVLVILNAIMFSATLVCRSLSNAARKLRTIYFAKKIYVVVGFNEQNKSILKTIDTKYGKAILFAEYSDAALDFAFVHKVAFVRFDTNDNIRQLIFKLFKTFDNKTVNVIVNSGDDSLNLIYTEQISDLIVAEKLSKYSIDDTRGLNAFIFGETENASAFIHFVNKTYGCAHYVNKYKLISMDFIDRFPITQFMTNEQLDTDKALVKNDLDLNIALIGFGKTNQQLFLTSVANNQLMTEDQTLKVKEIRYSIFDKKESSNDKNLNHNYFRFANEVKQDGDYLPLPDMPTSEAFFELDINNAQFYNTLRERLTPSVDKTVYNYIVIAFGSDLENLDFAEKLATKLKEWNLFNSTKIFLKIRSHALTVSVIDKEYSATGDFITFGDEEKIVYNLKQIVAERQEIMARGRHLCYSLKGDMTADDQHTAMKKALDKWYSWEQVQRESNIYACLSIRLKLQLLGFDYCELSSNRPCANEDFLRKYQCGDKIKYDDSLATVKGKRTVLYTNDFVKGSLRQTYAILEHQRWNAYMITCGFIPSTRAQLIAEGAKNMKLRRHSNLTTFEGLEEFRRIYAKLNNCSQEAADVIRYDYQIMDDLVWLLTTNGLKIVKK